MLGTRKIENYYDSNSINTVVSVGTARSASNSGLRGLRKDLEAVAKKATDPEYIHHAMVAKARSDDFKYYRLNAHKTLDINLDEWKPRESIFTKNPGSRTLNDISNAFYRWAASLDTIHNFEVCVEALVEHRRTRAKDHVRWERYATGSQFRCRQRLCDMEDFVDRGVFWTHLLDKHGWPQKTLAVEVEECRKQWQYQMAVSR